MNKPTRIKRRIAIVVTSISVVIGSLAVTSGASAGVLILNKDCGVMMGSCTATFSAQPGMTYYSRFTLTNGSGVQHQAGIPEIVPFGPITTSQYAYSPCGTNNSGNALIWTGDGETYSSTKHAFSLQVFRSTGGDCH